MCNIMIDIMSKIHIMHVFVGPCASLIHPLHNHLGFFVCLFFFSFFKRNSDSLGAQLDIQHAFPGWPKEWYVRFHFSEKFISYFYKGMKPIRNLKHILKATV